MNINPWMIGLVLMALSTPILAADTELRIKGIVDSAQTDVIFRNDGKVSPETFENGHSAVNRCFRIGSGYLTYIENREGLFSGYELNKYPPSELKGKNLRSGDEIVQNLAGIRLGMPKIEVERIINVELPSPRMKITHESIKTIKGTHFDVITTVTIGFENDELVKFAVMTSTTS